MGSWCLSGVVVVVVGTVNVTIRLRTPLIRDGNLNGGSRPAINWQIIALHFNGRLAPLSEVFVPLGL